jgi:hypothetical protein
MKKVYIEFTPPDAPGPPRALGPAHADPGSRPARLAGGTPLTRTCRSPKRPSSPGHSAPAANPGSRPARLADGTPSTRTSRPQATIQSRPLGTSCQIRHRPHLAHQHSGPAQRLPRHRNGPSAHPAAEQSQKSNRPGEDLEAQDLPEFDPPHSAEILPSTSTGPTTSPSTRCSTSPSTRVLDKLLVPPSPHRTTAEDPLPAGFLEYAIGRLVTHTAAGPGSHSTGAPRPDDPTIATSRWGRPAFRPPHCSPMGIPWG